MNARPGRKLAAEKNRVAAMTLYAFYLTDDFDRLPPQVRVSIVQLYAFYLTDDFDRLPPQVRVSIVQLCKCRWTKSHGSAALKEAKNGKE